MIIIWFELFPYDFTAAIFYAPKVREKQYTTIFDLLQEKYGKRIGGLLFVNELLADVFWESAILSALGTVLKNIVKSKNILIYI